MKFFFCMLPTVYLINMQKSYSNTLYFGLHKNDKRLDLGMYISNLKFYHILLFLCSP
jgi:hypothetical protein